MSVEAPDDSQLLDPYHLNRPVPADFDQNLDIIDEKMFAKD